MSSIQQVKINGNTFIAFVAKSTNITDRKISSIPQQNQTITIETLVLSQFQPSQRQSVFQSKSLCHHPTSSSSLTFISFGASQFHRVQPSAGFHSPQQEPTHAHIKPNSASTAASKTTFHHPTQNSQVFHKKKDVCEKQTEKNNLFWMFLAHIAALTSRMFIIRLIIK